MPKIGGFSFASVPRPRAPLRRFFYRGWMPFATRNDVNFIALDKALETRCRLAFDNAFSALKGHRLHIIFIAV
ncbi:MAG: hypothetical protein LGR52_16005 [Candidatus Thiosymbion ectosymbiont of Robbea hypermnestra]|nr:hypothetical protein [Candidatus Thiosymbion ectosymbiont of Robbea hypermnestra]